MVRKLNFLLTAKLLEDKKLFFLSGLFFWAALELGYRIYVNPIHEYSGFKLDINRTKYFEGLCLYVFLLSIAPRLLKRPSDYFINFLLFGLMTPLLILYGLMDQLRPHLYMVLLGYLIIDCIRRGSFFYFPFIKQGPSIAYIALFSGAALVSAWFIFSGGISFFNIDLTAVYESRRSVGVIINEGFMGYVNTWAYKVFGPALLAISLWKRAYWFSALIFVLHLYWFGVSSHKSVLFYPFLVAFIWVWFRNTRALSVIPLAMSGIVLSTLIIYMFFDYGFTASLFIRRVFFVLADNTFYYYEFFSNNDFIYWSNSILSSVIDYPYQMNYAELIGDSRGTNAHVNNTFLSTGYMHAGVAGIILYGVITGFLFRIIDSIASKGVPNWLAVSVLIVPSHSLLFSADLPTALLTHGVGIAVLILLLLRSNSYKRFSNKQIQNSLQMNSKNEIGKVR